MTIAWLYFSVIVGVFLLVPWPSRLPWEWLDAWYGAYASWVSGGAWR